MIIEYLNESADILDEKVSREELTLEQAQEAYDDIAEKAISEYTSEVLDAVEEGVLSPIEACFIFELCGIDEPVMLYTEADYDLSSLSAAQKREIQTKLASLSDAQRKKVEKELTKKFPSAEYKAKIEKRKKIAAGVGAAAGLSLAAGGAYLGHRLKKAEEFDKKYNDEYKGVKDAHKQTLKELGDSLVGRASRNDAEGSKARKELNDLSTEDRENLIIDYNNKHAANEAKLKQGMKDIRDNQIKDEGRIKRMGRLLRNYNDARKEDKANAERKANNAYYAQQDLERNKGLGRIKRALSDTFNTRKTKKSYNPSNAQIMDDYQNKNKASDSTAEANKRAIASRGNEQRKALKEGLH